MTVVMEHPEATLGGRRSDQVVGRGKAAAAVLLPLVLVCCCCGLLAGLFASSIAALVSQAQ